MGSHLLASVLYTHAADNCKAQSGALCGNPLTDASTPVRNVVSPRVRAGALAGVDGVTLRAGCATSIKTGSISVLLQDLTPPSQRANSSKMSDIEGF